MKKPSKLDCCPNIPWTETLSGIENSKSRRYWLARRGHEIYQPYLNEIQSLVNNEKEILLCDQDDPATLAGDEKNMWHKPEYFGFVVDGPKDPPKRQPPAIHPLGWPPKMIGASEIARRTNVKF